MLADFLYSRGEPAGSTRNARPRAFVAVVLAILLTGLTGAPASADEAVDGQHTVSKGQTLYAIARRYRTTVDAIREANGLKPRQRLQPGLVLTIPERDGSGASSNSKTTPHRQPERRGANARASGQETEPRPGRATGANAKKRGGAADKDDNGKAKAKHFAQKPKRPGWVRFARGGELLEVQLLTRQGRIVPKSLPKLSRLMRASPTASMPVDPRLATLVGMISDHFGGRIIRVVSGFRPYSTRQYTPHSNHNFGRAMDFVVEGVPNTVLRDFCRTFRSAGVGYYPNSTFVHLDVRSAKVYWVDYSRAGEAPRYDASKGTVAADEATRDVTGATEEEVYGPGESHPVPAQPSDTTGGNPQGEGGSPEAGKSVSPSTPSPPASPSSVTP